MYGGKLFLFSREIPFEKSSFICVETGEEADGEGQRKLSIIQQQENFEQSRKIEYD